MMADLYVQYGCGFCAPEGWINFDSSPTLLFEKIPFLGTLHTKNAKRFPSNIRYGDIVRGLPISPGSCSGVYCSHMLDYLALDDFRRAISNTRTILKENGFFRLVVEDCRRFMESYLADDSPEATALFMARTGWGRSGSRSIRNLATEFVGHPHRLWMWDFPSLVSELSAAGFHAIRRAEFGDSDDPHFSAVEEIGRWTGAIGIECRV